MNPISFKYVSQIPRAIAFGGLALVIFFVMVVLAISNWQVWDTGMRVATAMGVFTFGGLALALFLKQWLAPPDFVTKHGVGVWTNGITEITPGLVEEALDFYIASMLCLRQSSDPMNIFVPLTSLNSSLDKFILRATREDLESMLDGVCIEWRRNLVNLSWRFLLFCLFFPSYRKIRACELQHGTSMIIQWQGSISKSEFFHGLHHMVDEVILGEVPDYDHVDSYWWYLAEKFDRDFGK